MNSRLQSRAALKLPVKLRHKGGESSQWTQTSNIGNGGFFAVGVLGVSVGDKLTAVFKNGERGDLRLNCRVTRVSPDGAGVVFEANAPSAVKALRRLIRPAWDGKDLLDGVLKTAPWYEGNSLSDWLTLTTIVSNWRRPGLHLNEE